jgi:hypothetical protein
MIDTEVNVLFIYKIELIKVYDGIASFRHHSYKLISVPRHTSVEQLVAAAMWAFHLTGDPGKQTFPIGILYLTHIP